MVARFLGCAAVTHLLPHTAVQKKKFVSFWCIKKIGVVFPL